MNKSYLIVFLALTGLGLIQWALWSIWAPLTGITMGVIALRVAWNLDDGKKR